MGFDLLVALVFAIFAVMGAVRGTLPSAVRVLAVALAYGAAYFAATVLAGPAAAALGWMPMGAALVAGCVAFVGTWVVVTFAARPLLRRDRRRHEKVPRSGLDRAGGAFVGGAQGALIGLLLGVLGLWLDAALRVGDPEASTPLQGSLVQLGTQLVVEAGAEAAVGDTPGGRVAVHLMARPAETLSGLQRVIDNPRIAALQDDRLFWQYVSTGAIDTALNRGSFLGIAHDSTLRGELVDLGLVAESARNDPRLFRNASRDVLEQLAPALQELQNDPELRELAEDPEVQAALQSGNTLALMTHPRFRRLVKRVLDRTGDSA